jgi:glycosidase
MPFLYYGDEVGMTGGPDPDCRRGMLWDPKRQDQDLLGYYRRLIQIRKTFPCLTASDPCEQSADDEKGLVFIRHKELLLIFHGRDGNVCLSQYQGTKELLSEKLFDGCVGPYQAVILEMK